MTQQQDEPAKPDLLGPLGLSLPLPHFSAPPTPTLDPDLPGSLPPGEPTGESPDPSSPTPSIGPRARSMGTSSAGRGPAVSAKSVAHLLAGLLTLGMGLVAWGFSKRGYELRRPDDDELADVAEPAARILARHADLSMLSPDLADAVDMVAAGTEYVLSEPVQRAYQPIPDQPEPQGEETP